MAQIGLQPKSQSIAPRGFSTITARSATTAQILGPDHAARQRQPCGPCI